MHVIAFNAQRALRAPSQAVNVRSVRATACMLVCGAPVLRAHANEGALMSGHRAMYVGGFVERSA
eukprot:6178244-Pleurochrysis_carterae.AAC.1